MKISKGLRVFLFLSILIQPLESNNPCPLAPLCSCDSIFSSASCKHANLTKIPEFPMYVERIDFEGNLLESLNVSTFEHLENLNLLRLSLKENSIKHIQPGAFERLKHIRTLDLSENSLLTSGDVAAAIAQIQSRNFTSILLNFLYWKNEPLNVYKALSRFNIDSLYMRANDYETFNMNFVSRTMPNIRVLDIRSGRISALQSGFLKKLTKLSMGDNDIVIQKDFFGNGTLCFFPNLERLELRSNFINYFQEIFFCLERLQYLILDKNPVKEIVNDTFSRLPSLKALHLRRMGNRLKRLESFAFRSNSLMKIDFADNGFNFRETTVFRMFFDKHNIFRNTPKLVNLDLSGNMFDLSTDVLHQIILSIPLLRTLRLNDCTLKSLPTHIIYKIPTLRFMSVNQNQISSWNGYEVFGNRTTLSALMLSSNVINLVNETMFPEHALPNLSTISIGKNPLACTCGNMWFRNWIKQGEIRFDSFPEFYVCKSPPNKANTLFVDYLPSDADCSDNEVFLVVVTSLSVFGIVFIIIASILFRLRWHIRYWMYLTRVKQKGFFRVTEDITEYVYDGFVIYCDEDRKWVHQKAVQRIENESGLKLCIHHRDFDAGKLIVDNITENISISKKILLVISRDMVRSQWCLFETRIAQEKFLNKERDTLISIMLETIPKEEMSTSLRSLLNSTTYIEWPRKEYDEERFWIRIVRLMGGD